MNNKEFKKVFGEIAKSNGFERAFGGWFKESSECIGVLELQKSNFGNYYQSIIKIYIQGVFGTKYQKSKDLIKDVGDVRGGEPREYMAALNLDEPMDDNLRKERLEALFDNYVVPFTFEALTKAGITNMENNGTLSLLPAIKKELEKLA